MSDTAQVVMSWIMIFMVFFFALMSGIFLGKSAKLSSFHAQVNPIVERYGGESNIDEYNDGHNAQEEIKTIENRMNNRMMTFTVEPKTSDNNSQGDNHSNDVAGYGKPVSYGIHVHIPFISGLSLNHTPTYYTASKVGK